jgi:hypothetical protein
MTTTPIAPDVPVPDGAVPAGSEDFKAWGSEYRVVTTPDRVVTGRDNDARVWGAAIQFRDGGIDADGVEEEPHVWVEVSASYGSEGRRNTGGLCAFQ